MTENEDLDALRERLEALCRQHLTPAWAAVVEAQARPAIRLRHADRATRSHLGGTALLDDPEQWPRVDGRPLALVAVLDLAELTPFATDLSLPSEGVISFFYDDVEQPSGDTPEDRGGWRVVLADPSGAAPVTAPDGVEAFPSIGLEPQQTLTIPKSDEPAFLAAIPPWGEPYVATRTLGAFWKLAARWRAVADITDEVPDHQVGGWPSLIQGPIFGECAVVSGGLSMGDGADWERIEQVSRGLDPDAWRLLLQLDSDFGVGWIWGDVGRLYYAVRPRPSSTFGESWLVLQGT